MSQLSSPGMVGHAGHTWRADGYEGCGNVEPFLGSLRGRIAVVCGGGTGVFDQLESVLHYDPVILAANDVGMFLPKLDHWVSIHYNQFEQWKPVRWMHRHRSLDEKYHGLTGEHFPVDYVWELLTPCVMALSGYFAMQVAYLGGAKRVILAGCPGDGTPRFFEAHRADRPFAYGAGGHPSDRGVREQLESEMTRLPQFKAKVRSLSGWTKQYFGGP